MSEVLFTPFVAVDFISLLTAIRALSLSELQKRPSSISIAYEPIRIMVADTTGDVFSFLVPERGQISTRTVHSNLPLLSHFSLVTDCRARGNLIASCDRDNRIRISQLPRTFVIEAVLLAHKEVVSSVCWISDSRLASASADSSICLWDIANNDSAPLCQVFICKAQEACPMVVSVDVYPLDRDFLVAVTENDPVLRVFSGSLQANTLNLVSEFRPDGENAVTHAVFDEEGFLWVTTSENRAIQKYSVQTDEPKQFMFKLVEVKTEGLGSSSEANREVIDVAHVRPMWLIQLRKNPIVSDWKGKKRKAASSM